VLVFDQTGSPLGGIPSSLVIALDRARGALVRGEPWQEFALADAPSLRIWNKSGSRTWR
jgi:hypothetical protein